MRTVLRARLEEVVEDEELASKLLLAFLMGTSIAEITERFRLPSTEFLERTLRDALIRPSSESRPLAGLSGSTLDLTDTPHSFGGIGAQGVAELYELPQSTIARAIQPRIHGRLPNENLKILAECYAIIYTMLSSDRIATRIWLNRSNRAIYGRHPIVLVEDARIEKFRNLVLRAANSDYE